MPDSDAERFRIEVGYEHGVKPGNIVGAIANEAGLDGQHIGHIEIGPEFSLIDLPAGMPDEVFRDLGKVRVCGQPLNISRVEKSVPQKKGKSKSASKKKSKVKSAPRKKVAGKKRAQKRKDKKNRKSAQ